MFGKAKIQSYSVWKSQTREFHCLEKPKSRIPVFSKAKIQSSSVWKSQTQEFRCLEKQKSRIPMLRKAKIQNVWFQEISRPPPRRELEIPRGWGGQRPRKFQKGGGLDHKITFQGGNIISFST